VKSAVEPVQDQLFTILIQKPIITTTWWSNSAGAFMYKYIIDRAHLTAEGIFVIEKKID